MSNNESLPKLTHEKNLLIFWEEASPNGTATAKMGRQMFDKVLMVRISVPGDKSSAEYEVERYYPDECPHPVFGKVKVNDAVAKRFGKYIEEHKEALTGPAKVDGTPIDHWPMVDTRMCAHLKLNGVYSVEALAAVSDGNAAAMGAGIRGLIQKAKDWLQSASNSAAAMEAQENARRVQGQIEELQDRFNGLAEALEALPDSSKALVKEHISKRGKRAA